MKIYFLFGSDAVANYQSGELNMPEHDDYCTFAYDTETSTPQALLSAYDGWRGYCEISEEDYDHLTRCNSCGHSKSDN